MNEVEKQLAQARDQLIDMTGHNRLLNFKPTKAKTIRIVKAEIKQVFERLVEKEGGLRLIPKQAVASPAPSPGPADDIKPLETEVEEDKFATRLSYVSRMGRTLVDEQGYNGLHLALGFLEWKEADGALGSCKAPILLIPLEIGSLSARSCRIVWNKEDVRPNGALQVKFQQMGIEGFPDFPQESGWTAIDGYFRKVELFGSKHGWAMDDSIYMDFFNFTKIIMWRDLHPANWPQEKSPVNHRVLKLMFEGMTPPADLGPSFSEEDADRIDFKNRFYVQDADPSQIAVIEEVRKGRNLVVSGPPGTGKSQTIVNLIGEMLAVGKKVLFVSQKLAALKVVKSRLDQAKIGDFCMELHGKSAKPKEFVAALRKTHSLASAEAHANHDDKFAALNKVKERLNAYAEALRKTHDITGKSTFELFSMRQDALCHFESSGRAMPAFGLNGAGLVAPEKLNMARDALSALKVHCDGPVSANAWFGCNPTTIGHDFEVQIKSLLDQGLAAVSQIEKIMEAWKQCGINGYDRLPDLSKMAAGAEVVLQALLWRPPHVGWFSRISGQEHKTAALAFVEKTRGLQSNAKRLGEKFQPWVLEKVTAEDLEQFFKLNEALFQLLHPFKAMKLTQELKALFKPAPLKSFAFLLTDVNELVAHFRERQEIRMSQNWKSFFSSHWYAEASDCDKLCRFIEWGCRFNGHIADGILSDSAREMVCHDLDAVLKLPLVEAFQKEWTAVTSTHSELTQLLGVDLEKVFGNQESITLSIVKDRWTRWQSHLGELHDWSVFAKTHEACLKTLAGPVAALLQNDTIGPEDLLHAFWGNVASAVLIQVVSDSSDLKWFTPAAHQADIEEFKKLDSEMPKWNQERLRQKLRAQVPKLDGPPGSPEAKLKLEFLKKAKHKPIRRLFKDAGALILRIKPCVMMSPLSVAQYLEPGTLEFDVVIFDEASQVPPADALGAILRGKQLVVMGDSNQLPPTSFFAKMFASDEDGDGLVAAMDNILDLCSALFGENQTKRLRWHYRSKHESLIAVSNQEFYGNSLIVFPSPKEKNHGLGLHFEHGPDCVYGDGGSGVNRGEATKVAQEVIKHFHEHPEFSLGVGTFSLKQSDEIWEEVKKLRLENPDLDYLFSQESPDAFFVKNLETIQGDERDVIFISVGYGHNKAGVLKKHFGPLILQGGERRLNVLITRARRKCVVFCNFLDSDLLPTPGESKGVKVLRTFLEYAHTGSLAPKRMDAFESPFEESVADAVKQECGIDVHPQVGCVGYRIDLGIPNPDRPGEYVLGIECDGRSYHTSKVARERDRLRQQVLEAQGWNIFRVWSTDWYHARSEAQKRVIQAVKEALAKASVDADHTVHTGGGKPEGMVDEHPVSPPVAAQEPVPEEVSASTDPDGTVSSKDGHQTSYPHRSEGLKLSDEAATEDSPVATAELISAPLADEMGQYLLHMIFLDAGEVPDDHPWEEVAAHVMGGSEKLRQITKNEFLTCVQGELTDLCNKGLLKKSDYSDWILTDKGRAFLDKRGLL